MKCSVWNIVNNYVIFLYDDMVMTYGGDNFEMYSNIRSLCCITGTIVVLQIKNTSKTKTNKKKNSQEKRSDMWLPEAVVGGTG